MRNGKWVLVLVALALLLSTTLALAHPFDGDGSGPVKEGGSNAQAYLYVEPFTCRVECLLWLPTALSVFSLPQGDALLLPDQVKAQLMEKARAEAAAWCVLKVDGVEARLEQVGADVLGGVPGRSVQPVEGQPLAVMDAMLGITWEFPTAASFENVEIEWRGFSGAVKSVPVTVGFGFQSEAGLVMTEKEPKAVWKNAGRLPAPKPLAEVPRLPAKETMRVPVASAVWVIVALFLVFGAAPRGVKSGRRMVVASAIVCLGAAAFWNMATLQVVKPWGKVPLATKEEAQPVLSALLRNTYRAFDQRGESAIYDVLARSIHGDLLQKLYLQTARALTLEAQDGTRVKVTDLDVQVDTVRPIQDREGFIAEGQWTALGTVGHWGHQHQRINRYTARLTVEPVEGAWKLTGLEVLEERRL